MIPTSSRAERKMFTNRVVHLIIVLPAKILIGMRVEHSDLAKDKSIRLTIPTAEPAS